MHFLLDETSDDVPGTFGERNPQGALDPRYGKGFVFLALDANSNPGNRVIHVYVS